MAVIWEAPKLDATSERDMAFAEDEASRLVLEHRGKVAQYKHGAMEAERAARSRPAEVRQTGTAAAPLPTPRPARRPVISPAEIRLTLGNDPPLVSPPVVSAIVQLSQAVEQVRQDTEELEVQFSVSAEAREKFAKSGVAMADGAYPIADAKHLAVAKAYYKQRKLAGHSAEEVRSHINRRAKALGLPSLDHDDHDAGDEDKPKRRKRGQQVAAEGGEPGGGEGPSGASGVAATLALASDDGEDADIEAEVRRYLDMARGTAFKTRR